MDLYVPDSSSALFIVGTLHDHALREKLVERWTLLYPASILLLAFAISAVH